MTMQDKFSDPLPDGTILLSGQYTIKKFLNDGGFGITYLATDRLGRSLVIKECFPRSICRRNGTEVGTRAISHKAEFRSIVKAFEDEARNLSKFEHPNIVKVHQVFEENHTAYMAMEYVEGQDFITAIEKETLTPKDISSIAIKLLSALADIHANGMLHRDISPDNILLSNTGTPVLIDFGAAKEEASQHGPKMTSIRVTKEGYSPQEFYVSGAKQFPSSDLYAFGATLYHAITGSAPVEIQARLLALGQEKSDPYVPLSERFSGYPLGLLDAINLALSISPKDRLPSAESWLTLIHSTHSNTQNLRPTIKKKILLASSVALLISFGVWQFNMPNSSEPNQASVNTISTQTVEYEYSAPKIVHTSEWAVEPPFTLIPDNNNLLEIQDIKDWVKLSTSSEWLQSGLKISTVNNQKIKNEDDFQSAALLSQDKPFPSQINVSVSYKSAQTDQIQLAQLQLYPFRTYELSNGMMFKEQYRNNVWELVVMTLSTTSKTDFQVGDTILAERVLGLTSTTIDELQNVLQKLEERNLPKGVFSVRRNRSIELANLPLEAKKL